MGNRTIKQVDAGKGFNQEGFCWSKEVITDESILALIEMRYNIQIAFAIEYVEQGKTKSIRIVTKDRKHYEITF